MPKLTRTTLLAACAAATLCACAASAPDAREHAIVDEELARAVSDESPRAAVIVVLDPRNGRVVAQAGWSTAHGDDDDLAETRAWITGSTLKPLTIAAALDAGVVARDTAFDCAPRDFAGRELHDWKTFGLLSVRDVIVFSSNVGASRVADALGLDALLVTLGRLRVFDAPGALPTVADAHGFDAALLAAGELASATPRQLVAAYGALFGGGVYHRPSDDGDAPDEPVLSAATAATTVALLEEAVSAADGTGRRAAIPGHRVAGKTGTADLDDGASWASFVGAILDADPPRVILVGLEAPKSVNGGAAAAPVFARVAQRLLAP